MPNYPHTTATLEPVPPAPPPATPAVVVAPRPPAPPRRPSLLRHVLGGIPTLLVFVGLGGLFVWGHHTGWTVPKFDELLGEKAAEEKKDWCEEHGVPESICVECHPELMPRPKEYGWCAVHGVHECPLEHPDVAQLAKPPVVTAEDRDRAKRALAFADRAKNDKKCKLHLRRIQFTSREAVDKAGVDVDVVGTGPVEETVGGPGELSHHPTRTARLSARAPGSVFRVFKQVGDEVAAGEVIALVDAAEVGKAKADLLQAVIQARLKGRVLESLRGSSSIPPRSVIEAEAAVGEARVRQTTAIQALVNLGLPVRADDLDKLPDDQLADRLQFLGIPPALAATFDRATTSNNLLPVAAPLAGEVVSRDVVAGEVVTAAKVLFVVCNHESMWLTIDLRLEDARKVAKGQKVRFHPDGAKADITGTVTWISPESEHRTRTVKVGAEIPRSGEHLTANVFGTGVIVLREEPKAVVVKSAAVHREGCCDIVFVRDKNYFDKDATKVFHVRTVRLGARDGDRTEIIAGVLPGEVVVTKGGDLLRTELLKGNLGAGCGCGH